jgi:hypothetical protein
MAKNEHTSKEIGSIAAKILPDPHVPMRYKRLAGSALTQRPDQPRWYKHLKKDPNFKGFFCTQTSTTFER